MGTVVMKNCACHDQYSHSKYSHGEWPSVGTVPARCVAKGGSGGAPCWCWGHSWPLIAAPPQSASGGSSHRQIHRLVRARARVGVRLGLGLGLGIRVGLGLGVRVRVRVRG